MYALPNRCKQQLDAGQLAIGFGLRQARTSDIAQIAKVAGYDWLFIDTEHSALTIDDVAQISVSALGHGVTPIVRVPGFEHHHATRALDTGAQGVVFPHVDTVEQARHVAQLTRFPPQGKRSLTGGLPSANFGGGPVGEVMREVNAATMVVIMLESPEAIARCDELAAVPGIDALLIGTNDLSAEMGIPGQLDDPRIVVAYEKLVAACRKHGKHAGMGGVYTDALLQRYIAMGARLVLAGSDLSFFMTAAKQRAGFLRAIAF